MIGYMFSVFVIHYVIVIAISYRAVISSVRHIINYTVTVYWSSIINVPRAINVIRVINIYYTSNMRKITVVIINYVKATNANNSSVIILNVNISRLSNTTIFVIINRNIFNLNNRAVIIILYVCFIIIT